MKPFQADTIRLFISIYHDFYIFIYSFPIIFEIKGRKILVIKSKNVLNLIIPLALSFCGICAAALAIFIKNSNPKFSNSNVFVVEGWKYFILIEILYSLLFGLYCVFGDRCDAFIYSLNVNNQYEEMLSKGTHKFIKICIN